MNRRDKSPKEVARRQQIRAALRVAKVRGRGGAQLHEAASPRQAPQAPEAPRAPEAPMAPEATPAPEAPRAPEAPSVPRPRRMPRNRSAPVSASSQAARRSRLAARMAQRTSISPTGCRLWAGAIGSTGYGRVRGPDGKMAYAHRVAYELANGSVPAGLCLDHLCRQRSCCNPDHLEPVTVAENNRRGDMTKLSAVEVECIRRQLRYGWNRAHLARHHGVSESTIHMIASGAVWKGTGTTAPLCSWCSGAERTLCLLCGDETYIRGLPAQLCSNHAFGEGKQTCSRCGQLVIGVATAAVVCARCQMAQTAPGCVRCSAR